MKLSKYLFFFFFISSLASFSQDREEKRELNKEEEAAELAKATQNPLAAMYSLPFQNNTTFHREWGVLRADCME